MKITLKGKGLIIGSIENLEDTGALQEFCLFPERSKITILADDEDITSKAILKLRPNNRFVRDYYAIVKNPPYYFRIPTRKVDLCFTFNIENFDVNKLRIITTSNELPFIGYNAKIADRIIYDEEIIKFEDNEENLSNYHKLTKKLEIEVIE